ncbi:hypothetical protein R6Q59_007334 [Mikania micrantha]|uniref:BHLH domain-containing protein n=1 Tax=Mikania micrantha TaxID=192012 RepID=A0A5N6Q0S9_9ASTR|nr:hypothetical protein E3N88_00707 [Mikania micrantha]KAD7477606.1 hypothetical protein E3N88_00742 [Mikania micrantha]
MRCKGSSSHTPPALKEKQRRDRMKDLYTTLAILLHLEPYGSKSLPEFLDSATASLTELKERVERLKARKEELEREVNQIDESSNINNPRLKMIQVTETKDMKLEVNMKFMVENKRVVPFGVLKVIEQGGAEIMSSSFSTVGQQIYSNIHAQAFQARLGFDAKLIESQLMELIY